MDNALGLSLLFFMVVVQIQLHEIKKRLPEKIENFDEVKDSPIADFLGKYGFIIFSIGYIVYNLFFKN